MRPIYQNGKKAAFATLPFMQPGKHFGVARVISKRGFCSRSEAERACREGRVALNGKPALDPETKAQMGDKITIDGFEIGESPRVYYAFNKPRGVLCSAKAENGKPIVSDFFKGEGNAHLFTAGRLDAASEGLILVTNDTEFANRITAPETHLEKTYHVQTRGKLQEAELRQMERGMLVPPRLFGKPEEFMQAKSAKVLRENEKTTWLEIVLSEGKNREIRRLLQALGHDTARLVRVKIGPYVLGGLKPGEYEKIEPRDFEKEQP